MAKKTLQLYRGTTAQNDAFTGAAGEVTMDITTNQLRVHDGSTAGGHKVAKDSDVVHLAGTETITGEKTFTTNTIYKLSTKPDGSNHYNTPIVMKDSDGVTRGYLRNVYYAGGSNTVGIQAIQEVGGVTQYAGLEVGFNNNGDTYTYTVAPAASNSTNSTQIATVGWVNNATKATNVVHRDSTETITGKKTFVSSNSNYSGAFTQKTSYIPDNYTKPSADQQSQCFEVLANDDTYLSWQVVSRRTDGTTDWTVGVRNRKSSTGSNQQATLALYLPNEGFGYATAPASDVNGSIVTTVNKNKASNGYFKLGNGLIVQWGTTSSSVGNTNYTINFPTAFSTASNWAFCGSTVGQQNEDSICIQSKSSTNIVIQNRSYNAGSVNKPVCWIAVGY